MGFIRGDSQEAVERARSASSAALAPRCTMRPRSRTSARSVIGRIFCACCSTMIAARPSSRSERARCARSSSSTMIGARPSSGSSSSSRCGLSTSARPIASICCSPPESWLPRLLRALAPGAGTARRRARSVHGPGRATAVRFSSTVSDWKMLRSCGTQPMPARARVSGASARDRRGRRARSMPRDAARHADQRVDQRRLAGAVAAQQRQRLALARARRPTSDEHDGLAVAGATGRSTRSSSAMRRSRRGRPPARADRRRSPPASPSANSAPLTSTVMRSREAEDQVHVVLDQQHRHVGRQRGDGRRGSPARSPAGTPAAGSSSSSTRGAQAKASAISSRRCLP